MKLSGVMIGSEDPKILGEFYAKVFGAPGWQDGTWCGFDIGGGNLMVGPHSEVKGKSSSPGRIMFVIETDDVRGETERMKGLGVEVVAAAYQPDKTHTPDMWIATLADPDGNYFQLMTPWKQ